MASRPQLSGSPASQSFWYLAFLPVRETLCAYSRGVADDKIRTVANDSVTCRIIVLLLSGPPKLVHHPGAEMCPDGVARDVSSAVPGILTRISLLAFWPTASIPPPASIGAVSLLLPISSDCSDPGGAGSVSSWHVGDLEVADVTRFLRHLSMRQPNGGQRTSSRTRGPGCGVMT